MPLLSHAFNKNSINFMELYVRGYTVDKINKSSCVQENFSFLWGVRRTNNNTVEEISNKNEFDVMGMDSKYFHIAEV